MWAHLVQVAILLLLLYLAITREQELPLAIKPVTLVSAIAITTMAAFAAPADENNDASPNEDCGTASNCGGSGGWRVILLA